MGDYFPVAPLYLYFLMMLYAKYSPFFIQKNCLGRSIANVFTSRQKLVAWTSQKARDIFKEATRIVMYAKAEVALQNCQRIRGC
jgi:hypothetical protein